MEFDRAVLLTIVGILLVLSTLMVLPYAQFVLAAAVLAFVAQPLQRRLEDHLAPTWAALVVLLVCVLAVVAPMVLIGLTVAGDAMAFARDLQQYELDDGAVEEWIAERTGQEVDLQATIQSVGETAAESTFGGLLGVFGTVTHLLIGTGLFLFLLYFFVRDGSKLVTWIRRVAPLPDAVTEELLGRLNGVTWAVLAGHVLVAIVQGSLAGLGLVVVGIPNAVFWTFIMIVLAVIPLVGTFAIWAPASVYLALEGQIAAAIGLAVYGTIVVGVSDDYLRPVIVDRYADVSPAVIIVGVVGGLSAFGIMGLFVGPIVVGGLRQSVEVYAKFYGDEAEPTDQ